MESNEIIREYFSAEERGDVDAVATLCADDVIVRNAAQPPQHGVRGVRDYVTGFRDRTSHRRFTIGCIATEADVAFASWEAEITFRAGVQVGPVVTRRPFGVHLYGICRFKFDRAGKIVELDVAHETSSVMKMATEAAPD